MIRPAMLLLALPLLGHCAAPPRPAAAQAEAGGIDCIDLGSVTSRRAEGPDSIRFDLIGGTSVINRLPGRCPGLASSRDFGALAFEVQGNRLCRGDKVRAVDPGLGGYRQSIPCPLGRFTPVAPDR